MGRGPRRARGGQGTGSVVCGGARPALRTGTVARKKGASPQQDVDRLNGEPACLDAGPTASRCVATALARSSALCMIMARREKAALDSDFRIRDCSRHVHEYCGLEHSMKLSVAHVDTEGADVMKLNKSFRWVGIP
jgi:hypothetical protein